MKRLIKKIGSLFIQPLLLRYLKKDRNHSYQGIRLLVKQGVFHPAFFFSTKFMLEYLQHEQLKGKATLELGAGSGLISIFCARAGAFVTALDINPNAVDGIKENAANNDVKITFLQSDLFSNLPVQLFDYILINPPYYRGEAKNVEEQAWFAGQNLEYFTKLFSTIAPYFNEQSKVLMTLCEGCELDIIKSIAKEYNLSLALLKTKVKWREENYLFALKKLLL